MGCLYRIEFPNGKSYIGITVSDERKRFTEHRYHAKRGTRLPVYDAMRAFGQAAKFSVLVRANDRDELQRLERAAIDQYETRAPRGYNLTSGGDGAPTGNLFNLGKKRSAATRALMSAQRKGKKKSAAFCARLSEIMKGNKRALGAKQSADTKARKSAAMKGRTFSPESIEKMRVAAFEREAMFRVQRMNGGR